MTDNRSGESCRFVLAKLTQIGAPMNMLEIGFSATAQLIRSMAARGLVKVTVEITPRGFDFLEREKAKKLRKETKARTAARAAELLHRRFG